MKRICIQIVALLIIAFPFVCYGEDKSGVTLNTVSLPSGPGSIEGLGSSFQPMLNTGSSRYAVQIVLPAGVAGNTPKLTLQYDSGKGDGPAGIGWSFGPGSISRQTDKGIPRYIDDPNSADDDHDGYVDEPDELDTFIGPDKEELVHIGTDTYRARIEGSFVRYRKVGEHWEADLKNGRVLQFGLTADARITDATGQKTFKWLLQRSIDPNGNVIEYLYEGFAESENIKYLSEIRYGPGASPWSTFYFARFLYEQKPDWRNDYRSGFLIKTAHRLTRIDVGIQGATPAQCLQGDWNEDTTPDSLIRRYNITYSDIGSISSQLTTITQFGADGVNYLPPLTFSYSSSGPVPQTISAEQALFSSVNPPLTVMDNSLVELVDLNRDGLADILKTDLGGGSHTIYENQGLSTQGSSQVITWSNGQTMEADDGLALQLQLAEDVIHLADMDGNGLADLIQTTVAGDVYYYENKGDFSWSSRKQMSIQDTSPPAPSTSKDITTADLDFDKRIDVVKSTTSGYSVWFNLGDGKYSYEVQTGGASHLGQVVQFSTSGVQTVDINGDRLTDVARVTPTSVIYNAGMGHGVFADAVEIPIPDLILTDGENGQVSKAKLTDINGDGLADLIIERAAVNELWFWLNHGTDSLSNRHVVTDMPSITSEDTAVRWADMNGNGTKDIVYADSSAAERLQIIDLGELINGSAHPNLITGIDNGLGVITSIEYRSSTEFYLQAKADGNPWQTTVPFPVHVVSKVTTTTGLDLDTVPGLDQYQKEFIYRDGFYEDREKQFRGFAEVKVIEPGDASAPTGVTVNEFFTGGPDGVDNDGDTAVDEVSTEQHREEDALKGMVRAVQTETEAGDVFNRTEHSWLVKTLLTGVTGTEIRFAYNTQTDSNVDEKTGSPKIMRTTFVYDDYGNVTEEKNEGAISIAAEDEVYRFTEYINDTTNWLIGLPKRSYTTDAGLQKASESLYYYDGTPFVGFTLGQATLGNLTRKQKWVEASTYVDSIRNQFDTYGNITDTRNANGSRRTITWDPTLNIFPVQEDIEVSGTSPDLTVMAAYNLGLGTLSSSQDFNNNQTSYGYDVFGRLTSIVLPGDSASFPSSQFAYTMADPAKGFLSSYSPSGTLTLTAGSAMANSVTIKVREVSGQAGTLDTVQYVDGLGRNLATVSEAEQNFVVSGAVLFNARGSVQYSFVPYGSAGSDYVVPSLANTYSEKRYDATGRLIELINPPNDQAVITSVATQYLPLEKTVTDENNNVRNGFYDGLGRLIQVQENNLGDSYLTSYTYDTMGNLTGIIDAQNNSKTMAYDKLGRKISMDDPDKGHMAYVYDAANNLIQSTDNKSQQTLFTYDGANRLLTVDYLDANGLAPDVQYHYDSASVDYPSATNLKGNLAWLEDLSGGAFYSFNERGNSDWMITRINDGGIITDYMSLGEYDAMGRATATTFPDGDRITYTYTNGGLLQSIPGFVDNIDYTESGQRSNLALSNNITSTYSYDPRLRLNGMTTTDTLGGTVLQDLSYTFDGIGNIKAIGDNRTLPVDSPRDNSQTFGYDDLYRLTSAQGTGYGAITYQYDKIGNMTFKSSPNAPDPDHIADPLINLGVISSGGSAGTSNRGPGLTGGQPGPHAASSTASGLSYTYDDNGNMMSRGTDTYEWDFANRLTRVTTSNAASDFVYNALGQRKIKKVDENGIVTTDYYIIPNYEIRDGKPVKFIFDGTRRIARLEGRATSSGEQAGQMLSLQAGWNAVGLDIEPDNPVITSVLATINGKYSEVWAYESVTQNYIGYVPSQGFTDLTELHGGRGYLVKVNTPCLLYITGTRVTSSIALSAGWNLIPSPSDASGNVAAVLNAIDGKYKSVWGYDQSAGKWQVYQQDEPAFLNNLDTIKPGHAYWVEMIESSSIDFTQQPPNKLFYHTDHLGSSSLVTDSSGTMKEETTYYPFGRPRHQEQNGFDSAYKFTGKEMDKATGLMYYEARYYDPVVSRFISVDPLYAEVGSIDASNLGKFLANPQMVNLYAYTINNPINMVDPTGLKPRTNLERLVNKAQAKNMANKQAQTALALAARNQAMQSTQNTMIQNVQNKALNVSKAAGDVIRAEKAIDKRHAALSQQYIDKENADVDVANAIYNHNKALKDKDYESAAKHASDLLPAMRKSALAKDRIQFESEQLEYEDFDLMVAEDKLEESAEDFQSAVDAASTFTEKSNEWDQSYNSDEWDFTREGNEQYW